MNTTIKLLAVLALALSALGVSTSAAMAAPPTNDTFTNATLVGIGFSETLDTTEATTDSDDTQLNASCGWEPPATDASVWYSLQGSGQEVVVDVSQSDYSAGVLVGTGTQGNLQTVVCSPDAASFFASVGTTYYVLAIDPFDQDGIGGNLSISFSEPPPPPSGEFTVDRFGSVNISTGIATISGTYTCINADDLTVFGDAHQDVGRFTIFGRMNNVDNNGTCDGALHTWSTEVIPFGGKFAGGKLLTSMDVFVCNPFHCAVAHVEETIKLRGGAK